MQRCAMRRVWRCLGCHLPGVDVGLGGVGGVCGRIWCGLLCVLVWRHNPSYVLCRCSQVWASCVSAAQRSAACAAMARVSPSWCGRGGVSGVEGGCGHMLCGLMCVRMQGTSPACVLCRCFYVRASYLRAALRSAACVALAVVSLTP